MPEEQSIQDLITDLLSWGLRPEDIASRTGAGVMTVYRWKNGAMKPRRMSYDRIAQLHKYEANKRERKG